MSALPVQLQYTGYAVALGLVQIVLSSHAASLQRGYRWSASPRDGNLPPLTGVAGRLERALRNFGETFPLFVAAVVVSVLSSHAGAAAGIGCRMYLWARVAFVLLYAAGVPLVRSLVWNVATIGIAVVLVDAVT